MFFNIIFILFLLILFIIYEHRLLSLSFQLGGLVRIIPQIAVVCAAVGAIAQMYTC